jgi:peptidoglycan/LPS O-acetylase OafA/YrhL
MAFAWFMTGGHRVYSVPQSIGMAGIGLAVIVSVQQVFRGIQLIPRGLSGLGMMLAAIAPWRPSPNSFLARWGQHSYGVYLCHVLVIELVRVAASKAHLPEGIGLDLVIFVLGLAGSIAVVLLLARSRLTAWLNG